MADIFISTSTFGTEIKSSLNKLDLSDISYSLNPNKKKLSSLKTAELAKDSRAIIAGVEDLTPLVENSKTLELICRLGVGIDNVPLKLCKDKGIKVSFLSVSIDETIKTIAT